MRLIRSRLEKLKEAHRKGDMEEMVSLVRSGLTRDLGGMCNARLYQHTWSGTKTLIEEYTEVVKYTIERIAHYCDLADPLEVERILVDMKAARQSFGNTGLMLSGGGTLGMCHIGTRRALGSSQILIC
jgi:TAG lipase/steryl ester hydrolase/phospholipase A2/LPA acyltransferase